MAINDQSNLGMLVERHSNGIIMEVVANEVKDKMMQRRSNGLRKFHQSDEIIYIDIGGVIQLSE